MPRRPATRRPPLLAAALLGAAALRAAATQCAAAHFWPNRVATCDRERGQPCTALVRTGPYEGSCDAYCRSFGHVCAWASAQETLDCSAQTSIGPCYRKAPGDYMLCSCKYYPREVVANGFNIGYVLNGRWRLNLQYVMDGRPTYWKFEENALILRHCAETPGQPSHWAMTWDSRLPSGCGMHSFAYSSSDNIFSHPSLVNWRDRMADWTWSANASVRLDLGDDGGLGAVLQPPPDSLGAFSEQGAPRNGTVAQTPQVRTGGGANRSRQSLRGSSSLPKPGNRTAAQRDPTARGGR
uniref:Uncharacterized protein n=1 Tax=Alexandrium monilatum TaxID=311494 RepID=A0A7S4V1B4_9DINO